MKIVDRFKEISKEIADLDDGTEHIAIVAAVLTLSETTETLAGLVGLLLEDYDAQPSDAQPGDAPIVAGPTQTGTIEADDDEDDPIYGAEDFEPCDSAFDPPILSGRQPVSLLQEVCQERDLDPPEYDITRHGMDDHIPKFGGTVTIDRDDDEIKSEIEWKYRSKSDAKRALATAMLVKHFGAKPHRGRS